MGVTASLYAFDAGVWTAEASVDAWSEAGHLDAELGVTPAARAWLLELETPLAANKAWNDNLAGDFAWSRAREHVEPGARRAIDAWLSHSFWDGQGAGCACGLRPQVVGEGERVYARELVEHIAGLACSLEPVAAGLSLEFGGESPRSERFHRPWIYDYDNFCALAQEWQRIFEVVRAAGPRYHLLLGVWV